MQDTALIPDKSLITGEMVDAYLDFHPDLNEETAITGLNMFIDGQGELPAALMNGNETFYPLMQAYWNASGHEGDMPESWKEPLVEIVGETVEEMVENPGAALEPAKLPETEATTE